MDEGYGVRVLALCAHPDDAEFFAGGLIVRHCQRGSTVRIISVTDGRSGHHEIAPQELVRIRRGEADAAGQRIGAEYLTWDFPDGSLQPDLKVRCAIIEEVRRFQPHLVLTHRPCDYHPDHRAVGQAVQDASYMVTVPHVCPDSPAVRRDPVVAYMTDLFTRPCRFRADIFLDTTREFDLVVQMAACHISQFFEWLPYHDGKLDTVPKSEHDRLHWLSLQFQEVFGQRKLYFQSDIVQRGLHLETSAIIEAYELSEYAALADAEQLSLLFPGAI